MGTVLNGKQFAQTLRSGLKGHIAHIRQRPGLQEWQPGLATILIGDDPASRVYVGMKEKACRDRHASELFFRCQMEVGKQ